ncbi:uncharacterized protein [Amphiura filiformis]|uniref:uncharacterized protein n=1 Tax=Amphiura filiformis TaxID=82378 RepID=UPI003B20B634
MAGLWIALTIALYISSASSNPIDNQEETCPISRGFDNQDAAFKVLMTVVSGDDNIPSSPDCQFHVSTPRNTNLYQVMTVGNHHFPQDFSFNYTTHSIGRMVECINDVCNRHPYYWMVFNGTTNQLLEKGVDETYPGKDSDIVWKYMDVTSVINDIYLYEGGNEDLTLPDNCEKRSSASSHPNIKVKFTAVNDRDPSWPTVCHLPVIATSGSTLGQVLVDAHSQHPKKFEFTTEHDETHGNYVTSINSLENEDEWNWLVYDPHTKELLESGLDDTFPSNHEAFLWRYTNDTHHSMGNCNKENNTFAKILDIIVNGFNYLYSFVSWSTQL